MIELHASAYTIPTDGPEADGTLEWTSTTMVLVEVRADGRSGLGWTYGPAAVADVVTGELASVVSEDVAASHEAMCRTVRNAGRPGICSMAISAVDCALWDLRARTLGLPLHRLLGAVRTEVPVYGSGGFTTYDAGRTREQLGHWAGDLGIPRVKIKIGESWGSRESRDLQRLELAREVVGGGVELYADANGAYSAKQAIRVAHQAADVDLRWFEEPVSSDDLPGLREVRSAVECEVAAGEYGYDLPYFTRIIDAVDCPQADVTRVGGITEFLRVAGLARAHGKDLSAHCAPHLHAAAMAAIPNARHIEWFHDHVRIESMLFDGALSPKGGCVRPREDAPGLGLSFKHADAERYRVR
ncbi:enolase C-terminal domain-like protein [Actinoallomurus sp. NPDC052308]|uniref:enolase C-terminal domain-like protein n=1 Tax=Actinoallomurus sp. NPDC052308 TaxID=3155530 RepID=UPI00342F318F